MGRYRTIEERVSWEIWRVDPGRARGHDRDHWFTAPDEGNAVEDCDRLNAQAAEKGRDVRFEVVRRVERRGVRVP